jgi:hypothetical protein
MDKNINMKEAIECNGTIGVRLQKLMLQYADCIGIKRIYVTKDSKIEITLLLRGDDEKLKNVLIFLKSHFPTEDNCTIVFSKKSLNKKIQELIDYDYKIELKDVKVGK